MRSINAKIAGISLLASLVSMGTYADSTGTITFNGELTDTTCEVDINGQGSDATVVLPTVGINELVTPGDVTGRTSFNMNLTNCVIGTNGNHNKVAAFFQPGSTVDLGTGRLINTSGSAGSVGLQLLDASNNYSAINIGNTDQVNSTAYININSDGSALLPYAVEYYADGQTTPGTVVSSVIYNLQYK